MGGKIESITSSVLAIIVIVSISIHDLSTRCFLDNIAHVVGQAFFSSSILLVNSLYNNKNNSRFMAIFLTYTGVG